MIALLLVGLALGQEDPAPPADLADPPDVLLEFAEAPDPIIYVGEDDSGIPWVLLMNGLACLGVFAGGAAGAFRMARGAPASDVRRISDPRFESMQRLLERTFSSVGVVKGEAAKLAEASRRSQADLVSLDPLLLDRIDRLIEEQAKTNELMAVAMERLPDLLEDA